jgi:hypothetical protein
MRLWRGRGSLISADQTLGRLQAFFPELTVERLPDSAAWAVETVELTTHNGTHLDAPCHFHPTTNHAVVPRRRAVAHH